MPLAQLTEASHCLRTCVNTARAMLKGWSTRRLAAFTSFPGASVVKLMFQETRSLTPEARSRVFELDAKYIADIQELIEAAAAESAQPSVDPELAANFIYFLCVIWPLRYWAIAGSYRSQAAFTESAVDDAVQGWERWRRLMRPPNSRGW